MPVEIVAPMTGDAAQMFAAQRTPDALLEKASALSLRLHERVKIEPGGELQGNRRACEAQPRVARLAPRAGGLLQMIH